MTRRNRELHDLDKSVIEGIQTLIRTASAKGDAALLKSALDLADQLKKRVAEQAKARTTQRRETIGLILGFVLALLWIGGITATAIWGKGRASIAVGTTSFILVPVLIIFVLNRVPEATWATAWARMFGSLASWRRAPTPTSNPDKTRAN